MEILHNPRCSKSRQALALLEASGVDVRVRLYLNDPLSRKEIEALIKKLECAPRDIMRRGEEIYKQLNLASADDKSLMSALVKHPILIERPIIITPTKALIARPPERVNEFFE